MRILAIDPATVCGVADSYGLRTIWNLNNLATHDHEGYRHLALMRALKSALAKAKYDIIAMERAAFGAAKQRKTAAFHSTLAGVVLLVAAEKAIPVMWAGPTELKKFATGFGNATKEDMIKAARVAGEKLSDDNIADAFWVLKWTEKELRNQKLCQKL